MKLHPAQVPNSFYSVGLHRPLVFKKKWTVSRSSNFKILPQITLQYPCRLSLSATWDSKNCQEKHSQKHQGRTSHAHKGHHPLVVLFWSHSSALVSSQLGYIKCNLTKICFETYLKGEKLWREQFCMSGVSDPFIHYLGRTEDLKYRQQIHQQE